MTWSAGERADAHQITSVLREKFARPSKNVSRDFVATMLAQSSPKVVLELWGGGGGTASLRAAMPNARIISVENGSVCDPKDSDGNHWFKDRRGHRITKARLKRAHLIDCEEQGVEAFWGDLGKAVAEFTPDAAHADLCEQWSPSLARLLASFAGIKTLAVTIMPERDGLGHLGLENRLVSLAALVSAHTGMVPIRVTSYERNDFGQDMGLLIMERRKLPRLDPQAILRSLLANGRFPSITGSSSGRAGTNLKKCPDCGTSFVGHGQRYCRPCAVERTKTVVSRYGKARARLEPCSICGLTFEGIEGNEMRLHRYACRAAQPKRCLVCGLTFESRERLRHRHRTVPPLALTCSICGLPFEGDKRSLYCTPLCAHEGRMREQRRRRQEAVAA